MAGEFRRRLVCLILHSKSLAKRPESFAPWHAQDDVQSLARNEQTNNNKKEAIPCPPWKKLMAGSLAARYGTVPRLPMRSPSMNISLAPTYHSSRRTRHRG